MAAGDGLISMTPSSIAHSGTSASINADGGVDFTAVTELNLNGVFTSDYDNYLIVAAFDGADANITMRLRASGSDASGSDYTLQHLLADGSTVTPVRTSSSAEWLRLLLSGTPSLGSGGSIHIYGPALAQPTAVRSVVVSDNSDAILRDAAGTHSLSTSYDGFTIYPSASSITGNVHVFGYEE